MNSVAALPYQWSIALLVSALLISGCSSSNSTDSQVLDDAAEAGAISEGATGNDGTTGNSMSGENISSSALGDESAQGESDNAQDNNAPDTGSDSGTGNDIDTGDTGELSDNNDPATDNSPQPVKASLTVMADKTFRIGWQPSGYAQFYRVLENPDGVSGFSQIGEDIDASTFSYDHRVALYKRVNARYMVQACNAAGCVDSEEQIISGSLMEAITYIKASNADVSDRFGGDRWSNAISLSADGTILAVGAPGETSSATGVDGDQSDNTLESAGAVYIFVRSDNQWQQQAYLKSSNTNKYDFFGIAVSLNADGTTLAVGAPNEDSAGTGVNGSQEVLPFVDGLPPRGLDSGAVYLFSLSNDQWQQSAYIKASNSGSDSDFGGAVNLSRDGKTLAVGASGQNSYSTDPDDSSTAFSSGAVYVFTQDNGNWQEQAFLKANNPDESDLFGDAISLSADGNTLAVGAHSEDSAIPGLNGSPYDDSAERAGAVYVFAHSNGNWQQQVYLKSSNPGGYDYFGRAVSLSADGNTLVIGSPGEASASTGLDGNQRDNSSRSSGAVYIFRRKAGNWQQETYLKASNTGMGDSFGDRISLSADGLTMAVAASREDSATTGIDGDQTDDSAEGAGAVYIFSNKDGSWQQQAYVKAGNTDEDDAFGGVMSLSDDGDTLAVSSPFEGSSATGINGDQDDNSGPRYGAVYLY